LNYSGVLELTLNDTDMASFYENKLENKYFINQYMIIKNCSGEVVDEGRWTKEGFTKLKYKPIENKMFGKISPRNQEQRFMFDLLQNSSIVGKLVIGNMGSGKTMISLVHALDFIVGNKPKYDKLVYLRNNIITKNTNDLGALPSDITAKIKPFAMPLCDILGDESALDNLIQEHKIVLEHIGFIRGRSYKNSIVFVSEAQNIDRAIAALIVARIGEGSILIVEGDLRQSDKVIFEKESGICAMAEALKGDYEFGMVTLKKNERSRFASLSDLIMDEESKK
jgi:PhoH-like ATPase